MIERDFTSREAAELAGINPATFRSYFRAGHFRVVGSMERKEAAKDGLAHVYSWFDVMGFAVVQSLIDWNVHPRAAFDAAFLKVGHTGDDKRDPGGVYDVIEHGPTLLAYNCRNGAARVFAGKNMPLAEFAADPLTAYKGASLLLTINYIERDVMARLKQMQAGD